MPRSSVLERRGDVPELALALEERPISVAGCRFATGSHDRVEVDTLGDLPRRVTQSFGWWLGEVPVAGPPLGGDAGPMSEPAAPRLLVELELTEPIEGRILGRPGSGLERPFRGWLALLAAVERARSAGSRTGPEEDEAR